MKWTNPQHKFVQGYPVLEIEIDGQLARIPAEQKPTLIDAGIVFIGSKFKNYTVDFQGRTFVGFVQDEDFYKDAIAPFLEWANAEL